LPNHQFRRFHAIVGKIYITYDFQKFYRLSKNNLMSSTYVNIRLVSNGLQVGFVSEVAGAYWTAEWSGTSAILNMAKWSNVGLTGRWLYRVDELEIKAPNDVDMPGKVALH
jgi:predicted exporter